MGVDARMFARIRDGKKWLKPEDVLPASRELASVFGPGNFLITKGWECAYGEPHHALSIVVPFKEDEAKEYEQPEWAGRVVWLQDGDPIFADPGEQFVEVHLMHRYYGPDYARGNWPVIRGVAEWLEMRFPGCEVWYGGDSSGICAEPFAAARREEFNRFYLSTGHSTYGRGFDGIFAKDGNARPTCPCCEVAMRGTGSGAGRTLWCCDSCEARATSSGQDVKFLKRGEDW